MALRPRLRRQEPGRRTRRGLKQSLPRALGAPAGPQSRKQPSKSVTLHVNRLAAARRALGSFREKPGIHEGCRDDAEDEQAAKKGDEYHGVAHGYIRPSTTSHLSTKAKPSSIRSITSSAPSLIFAPSTLLAATS